MVTDRDIACRAVSRGLDPEWTSVSEVMSKGITYCFDDQDVSEAAHLMEKIHRLPVLNRRKSGCYRGAMSECMHRTN